MSLEEFSFNGNSNVSEDLTSVDLNISAISAIYNDNLTVQDHIAKIQAVTAKDVQAFAKKTFAGKPTFVTIGEAQAGLFTNWLILHDPFTFFIFWGVIAISGAITQLLALPEPAS